MADDLAPLTPSDVLATLQSGAVEEFNEARSQHPQWQPVLPRDREVQLARCNLSHFDLRGMDLQGIDFTGANLSHAKLEGADLSGASLLGADLQATTVHNTRFVTTKGLFGRNRARMSAFYDSVSAGTEYAILRKTGDHLPWSILRSIGTLRIFGVSYTLILVLIGYAGIVEWVNDTAFTWASAVPGDNPYAQHFRQLLLSKVPLVEVAPQFGVQLLMVLCLAVGATIYEFFCPDVVKENTESRWTRELNQNLLEYRAAEASAPRARMAAFFFYGIGGLYTSIYLSLKILRATLYFLGVLGAIYT